MIDTTRGRAATIMIAILPAENPFSATSEFGFWWHRWYATYHAIIRNGAAIYYYGRADAYNAKAKALDPTGHIATARRHQRLKDKLDRIGPIGEINSLHDG